jgi:hypothetical protein
MNSSGEKVVKVSNADGGKDLLRSRRFFGRHSKGLMEFSELVCSLRSVMVTHVSDQQASVLTDRAAEFEAICFR